MFSFSIYNHYTVVPLYHCTFAPFFIPLSPFLLLVYLQSYKGQKMITSFIPGLKNEAGQYSLFCGPISQ